MKVTLTGTVLEVKTDAHADWNFVSVVQKGGGGRASQADVVYRKSDPLPKVGDEISIVATVKAKVREYQGKHYGNLAFGFVSLAPRAV